MSIPNQPLYHGPLARYTGYKIVLLPNHDYVKRSFWNRLFSMTPLKPFHYVPNRLIKSGSITRVDDTLIMSHEQCETLERSIERRL
jgi:hypothetical protein